MAQLFERDLIDPETEVHYACHKTIKQITGAHNHDFFEIFLVTAGSLYHCINGRKELLIEGAMVFVRPQDYHYYENNEGKDCELINLAFPRRTIKALIHYLGEGFDAQGLLSDSMPPQRFLTKLEISAMKTRLDALTLIPAFKRKEIRAEVRALLAEVFVKYFANHSRVEQSTIPKWLSRIEEEMKNKENFTAGLPRLYELANHSPEHISRMVKKYYGKTPTEWINGMRLNYAANLLVYTDDTILGVSMESGFENVSHFYHEFHKAFQTTPARYRKRNRKIAIPK